MKTVKLTLITLSVLSVMAACNKGNVAFNPNGNTNGSTNPTDQAASLVTASLAVSTDGAFNTISDVSVETQAHVKIDSLCGTTWTDSVSRSIPKTPGGISYNYFAKYTYALNCDSLAKNGIYDGSSTATSNYSGSYTGPNLSSTNSGSSTFTIAGLGRDSTSYLLNGTYMRGGSYTSKTDTGTNNVQVKLINVQLSKPFQIIKGGNASITVTGTSNKNGSFSYSGVLVFNGGNLATLTLNGTVYDINLATGAQVRQ